MNFKIDKKLNKCFSALKKLRPKKLNCNYINESNKERLNYVLDPTTLIFSPKSSLYPKKICKLSPKTHLFSLQSVFPFGPFEVLLFYIESTCLVSSISISNSYTLHHLHAV